MHHAADGDEINQAVQLLPAALKPSLHGVGGGDGKWDEQHKAGEAHGDKRPLDHIFDDCWPLEELIPPDISREMQTSVKEGK